MSPSSAARRDLSARLLLAVLLVAAVTWTASTSYAVRTVTALAAAGLLLRAARAHADGLGRARRLFAAALLVGAGSGVASAVFLVVTGHPAATGWFSDWLYLTYGPLAVAGTVALPRSSGGRGSAVRALADGAVAAGSLWYLAIAVLIEPRHLGDDLAPAARIITLAFP